MPAATATTSWPTGRRISTTALAAGRAAGWPVVWSGGDPDSARYAYFEPPAGPATVIELMELYARDGRDGRAGAVGGGRLGRQRPDPGADGLAELNR